jgi:DNA-binding NarL/FixJ family response regulator
VWLGERSVTADRAKRRCLGARVLVADDHDRVRDLYLTLLREVAGISSFSRRLRRPRRRAHRSSAALPYRDSRLNMPRVDGVEAALLLRRDCPSTRVAVHSSDPDRLKERAAGLGLAVFDKLEFELLLAWVGRQARQGLGLRPWRRSHRGVATSVPFVAMASLAASP